jgi:cbb3-type cytochrome oxidase subunit 1
MYGLCLPEHIAERERSFSEQKIWQVFWADFIGISMYGTMLKIHGTPRCCLASP